MRPAGPSGSALAKNPLSRFLAEFDDLDEVSVSQLEAVARRATKEPFDESRLRADIVSKLKNTSYPQPLERRQERAPKRKKPAAKFYDRLGSAKTLSILLRRQTLNEIWNCLLIPKIVAETERLKNEKLSAAGYPLAFHRMLRTEARKRLERIEELTAKYGLSRWMQDYERQVRHQLSDNVGLLIGAYRARRSQVRLLAGKGSGQLKGNPWSAELVADVAIYHILRTRLPYSSEMSDAFIQQLAPLIRGYLGGLGHRGEAIRNALSSAKSVRRNSRKLS